MLVKSTDKNANDPKSYRPICLLSGLGKVFEKLVKERLITSLSGGEHLEPTVWLYSQKVDGRCNC